MVTEETIDSRRRQIRIGLPYPGDVISVNHYLGRARGGGCFVKTETKEWMDMLGWSIKTEHLEDWQPGDVDEWWDSDELGLRAVAVGEDALIVHDSPGRVLVLNGDVLRPIVS